MNPSNEEDDANSNKKKDLLQDESSNSITKKKKIEGISEKIESIEVNETQQFSPSDFSTNGSKSSTESSGGIKLKKYALAKTPKTISNMTLPTVDDSVLEFLDQLDAGSFIDYIFMHYVAIVIHMITLWIQWLKRHIHTISISNHTYLVFLFYTKIQTQQCKLHIT